LVDQLCSRFGSGQVIAASDVTRANEHGGRLHGLCGNGGSGWLTRACLALTRGSPDPFAQPGKKQNTSKKRNNEKWGLRHGQPRDNRRAAIWNTLSQSKRWAAGTSVHSTVICAGSILSPRFGLLAELSATLSLTRSKLKAKHELNLPWQAGTGVRGCRVIVVIVEIVGRVDRTQRSDWLQHLLVGYWVPGAIWRLLIVEGKIVRARVAELSVIEDVEHLHAELGGDTLCYFGRLHQRHVDLPRVERPNQREKYDPVQCFIVKKSLAEC
jgi:hypothetical protein